MPEFLGATVNHHSIYMSCPFCGHTGYTSIQKSWGTAAYILCMMTFGIGACCPAYDTIHTCQNCQSIIGVAKLM